MTVVLEPMAVTELLQFLSGSLNARRADEGRSFFSKAGGGTQVGEKIFGDAITLRSDPTDPTMPGPTFDGEGVPLAPTSWIDKGTLTGLVYNRYWAKKQGKQATGFPNRWALAGGTATRDELVKGVTRGVLITRFWYLRMVDPQAILVTGLTRDGTFLIEKGEIVAPVNNFRFNESPAALLANVEAMSRETARTSIGWRVPAIRAASFNLASISEAV
jgi:predicted Zn-dependent protease